MKKKVLAVVLAAAMVLGLAACGSSGGAEGSTGGAAGGEKELKVQVGPNPETIDPALNSAVDGGNMLLHAFECLLTVDQDGQLAPGCAETWETSEDGLTWTDLSYSATHSKGNATISLPDPGDYYISIKNTKNKKLIISNVFSPEQATSAYFRY